MASLTVSNVFISGTTILSAAMNTNFDDIETYVNNRNSGAAAWERVLATNASEIPAVFNNSTGTNDILNVQDNSSNVFAVADGGTTTVTATNGGSNKALIVNNGTSSGNILELQDNGTAVFAVADGGNITATKTTAGVNLQFTMFHSNNSNAASHSALVIETGGASGGDPYINFTVLSATNWSIGIDNSDSDSFKIATTNVLGSADIISITTAGNILYSTANVGGTFLFDMYNTNNSNAASAANIRIRTGGSSGGDASLNFSITSAVEWSMGLDNSDSDNFKICASNTLGTTDILSIAATGSILHSITVAGGTLQYDVYNPDNTAGANAGFRSRVGGASSSDPFHEFVIQGVLSWIIGIDNSDSDKFKISRSNAIGTSDIITASATTFDPVGTGAISSGNASHYWNDISYKTLTDQGCLPWADDGVELQDGRIVSDCEALSSIEKHPTKITIQGLPMLNYKTFPKVSYKKAKVDGEFLPRDENDEPIGGHDGVEMTSMFGFMIGAIRELNNRLKLLEKV